MWKQRTPRKWQVEALHAAQDTHRACVIQAVTGAGKSDVIHELADQWPTSVLIATPSIALVEQLALPGYGRLYTHAKSIEWITVACFDSLALYPATTDLLVIIDECHESESPSVLAEIRRLAPKKLVGFTATPFRSSVKEDLSLFDELAFAYDAAAAFRDGVCHAPQVRQWTGASLPVDDVVDEMLRSAPTPALVTARSIDDAEAYAARLGGRAIHSQTPDRDSVVEGFRGGAFGHLVHVDLVTRGVDWPWLRCLALRVPIGSSVKFCQQVGRVMRSPAVILDPHDLFGVHSLTCEAALNGAASRDEAAPVLAGHALGRTIRLAEDPMPYGIWIDTSVNVWQESRPGEVIRATVERASNEALFLSEDLGDWRFVRIAPAVWSPRKKARLKAVLAEGMTEIQAWLRQENLALAFGGHRAKVHARPWRKMEPSTKQREFLERLVVGAVKHRDRLAPELRAALNLVYRARSGMDRGTVSDSIEIMLAVCRGLYDWEEGQ